MKTCAHFQSKVSKVENTLGLGMEYVREMQLLSDMRGRISQNTRMSFLITTIQLVDLEKYCVVTRESSLGCVAIGCGLNMTLRIKW